VVGREAIRADREDLESHEVFVVVFHEERRRSVHDHVAVHGVNDIVEVRLREQRPHFLRERVQEVFDVCAVGELRIRCGEPEPFARR
jgi:hypothetical protein